MVFHHKSKAAAGLNNLWLSFLRVLFKKKKLSDVIKMKTWCYEISVYILQTWSFSIRVHFLWRKLWDVPEFHSLCWNNTMGLRCLWLIAVAWKRILGLVSLVPNERPAWQIALQRTISSLQVCVLFLLHRSNVTNYIFVVFKQWNFCHFVWQLVAYFKCQSCPKLEFSIWKGRDASIS